MSTAAEKAKELADKYRKELQWIENDYPVDLYRDAKACAIICVDEILDQTNKILLPRKFWEDVKTELQKL